MDVPAAGQGGDGTSKNRRKGPGKRSAACSHTCTEAASTVDGAPPTNAPCGACKFLRRKCIGGCIFAPHFGSDQGAARFAAVHKVFGASNVSKLLLHIPPNRRHDAVVTISYEAQARLSDPVYGCVSTIIALQQQELKGKRWSQTRDVSLSQYNDTFSKSRFKTATLVDRLPSLTYRFPPLQSSQSPTVTERSLSPFSPSLRVFLIEGEMLWVDKYRPKTLDKVLVHEDIAQNLKKLVTEQDCPHLLFYGPSGSGKKTLIMALLRQIFGPGADKVKVENKNWKVDAGARTIDVELTTTSSAHHVEMNPSDAGFQDRYVVQEIIKEMAKNRPIDTKGKKGFKVLVLNEVDKLSREAQHSLRRTMEKYSSSCRLILCSNSSSKVTEAIRSRCLNMRINAPTEGEIVKVLEFIGKKEGLQLPPGFADRIAQQSNRSLRRAILLFETCRVQQYPFAPNQAITPMDWEEYVSEIASSIFKEQSPKRLFEVRGKLYELLLNCIPPEIILKRLLYELLKKLDSELKHEICHWAAYYEHRLRLGQKAIFHLEAFVAKFMSIYKGFLIETFG
ncbi:ATPase [Perilla frutescens var. hirtella]|nr:ATPase [Perilla frutescens var. hirtella]